MENASLPTHVYDITTSASDDEGDDLTLYLANIRDRALMVVYMLVGTVGVLDNMFVIIVFFFFIKIAEKVIKTLLFFDENYIRLYDLYLFLILTVYFTFCIH